MGSTRVVQAVHGKGTLVKGGLCCEKVHILGERWHGIFAASYAVKHWVLAEGSFATAKSHDETWQCCIEAYLTERRLCCVQKDIRLLAW